MSEPTERDRCSRPDCFNPPAKQDDKGRWWCRRDFPERRYSEAEIAQARAEGYAAGKCDGAEEEAVGCAEHEKKARVRGAREEREAILADLSTDFWSASSPVTWTTLVELKKRIEARGKEGR